MPLDDMLDDGEAQARTADAPAAPRIDAVEAFGQAGQMAGGDAFAAVGDAQTHHGAVAVQLDAHRRLGLAVLHRVADQIVQHLRQLRPVARDRRKLLGQLACNIVGTR